MARTAIIGAPAAPMGDRPEASTAKAPTEVSHASPSTISSNGVDLHLYVNSTASLLESHARMLLNETSLNGMFFHELTRF